MKTITLTVAGLTIPNAFTTTVKKIVGSGEETRIVLDSLSNVEISLGGSTAESLEMVVGSEVTIKPGADNTFTLSVGKKEPSKATTNKTETRGSSPMPGFMPSNTLR